MDKNYYNSLLKTTECKEDIEKLKSMNNKELNKIIKFIEYSLSENAFRYTNALDVLNMNEDSISELLAWLIDQSKNEGLDDTIKKIKKDFCTQFLNALKIPFNDSITCSLRETTDKNKKPDIIIKSGDITICIIEVKKNAKISCTKGEDGKRRTQLEYYKKYYGNNPKYILIVDATSGYINSEVETHIKKDTFCKNESYDKIKGEEFCWLLKELGYQYIEHDAVTLILYNVLKKYAEDRFENGILKATNHADFINAIETINNKLCHIENKENIITFCADKQNKSKIEITYRESYKNDKLNQYNLYEKKIRLNKFTMLFHKNMSNLKKDEILNILCQYVEYWELATCKHHHLYGNTKIIDGEYIYNVCKALKRDDNLFENIPKKIQRIIDTMLDINISQ